jgi:hypothetical protein
MKLRYALIGLALGGCSSMNPSNFWGNLWSTVCTNQAQYIQNLPPGFLDPAQAALALQTLCGTVNPTPTPTPSPTATPTPTPAAKISDLPPASIHE